MNSAGRLLHVYDRLVGTGRANDLPMVKVWADVLQLPEHGSLEDDVVACLQALRGELDLLKARLLAMGVGEELLHPGLTRFRNVTSTAHINAGWNGLREEASRPENRIPLAWANWLLRDESEEDLAPDELGSLREELDALERSLKETDMSPYMRGFIERQLSAVRAALRLYPIRGAKPFEEAARQVVGTCNLEARVLAKEYEKAAPPAKGVFSKVGDFIEKTAKVADNLDKIRKAGEGAYSLVESVGPALLTWTKTLTN
jgi:hypothetical protein